MAKNSKDIGAKLVRTIRDSETTTIAVQTATAAYVDLAGSKVDARNASSLSYIVKNAHATLTTSWKVMASNDDATYVEVQAPAVVAAAGGTGVFASTSPIYGYYKIQIIDGSGHGTLEGSAIVKD